MSLFAVENVTVVWHGAVSAVQVPEEGTTGLVREEPSVADHLRITRVALDAVLLFCIKATCVPSAERTGEVRIAPVVPVLYAQ